MSFGMRVVGLFGMRERMAARRDKLADRRGVYLRAAVVVEAWVQRNFQADGKRHEDPSLWWPPLKPSTIARRRQGSGVGNPQILRDTGRLRGGFETRATARYGEVRNRVEYAVYHEEGNPRGRPPQRKMLPARGQAETLAAPLFKTFVREAIK